MTLQVLIAAVVIASLLQPTVSRAIPAILYAFMTAMHYVCMDRIEGPVYYVAAAIIDFTCLSLAYWVSTKATLSYQIMMICFVSIIINTMGWIMYMAYMRPDTYNMLSLALYLWAIAVLLKRDKVDVVLGHNRLGGWLFGLRPTDYSRLHITG